MIQIERHLLLNALRSEPGVFRFLKASCFTQDCLAAKGYQAKLDFLETFIAALESGETQITVLPDRPWEQWADDAPLTPTTDQRETPCGICGYPDYMHTTTGEYRDDHDFTTAKPEPK